MTAPFFPDPSDHPLRSGLPVPIQQTTLVPVAPKPAPRLLLQLLLVFGGLLVLLFTLAALVPIGGAVIGQGEAGAETRNKRIAHPTGGVIREILVHNGQHVAAGQLLLRLDDNVTGADAQLSNLTVEQLLAEKARLEAERVGRATIDYPDRLTKANSDSARKAMADENRLFHMRQAEEAGMMAELTARAGQYREEIRGYEAQIAALHEQLRLIEPERRGVKDLWDRQLTTISRLNQLERTAVELSGNIASLEAQIAQSRAKITEADEQAIQVSQSRRVQAGNDLNQITTALNEQQIRSVSAADQSQHSEIHAPYSGTIEKVAFAAVGDVIRPAEPIMEIVPDRDDMVVEAMIRPTDINQVAPGQAARVRFSSFNRAVTPEIKGKVSYVASDRTESGDSKTTFYIVRIELNQTALHRESLDLRSGMPAEAYIETGSRSLLSYLFKPLRDQFARAFKDN